MKCVSFHRDGFEEFGGSQCISEGFRWRCAVMCCLEILWRLRKPAGSRKQGK